MGTVKKHRRAFNKKWLLLALLPLTAAMWKFTDNYNSNYYHRPLDISTELAANFGEVRANHFHMGLDIRTNGKENLPVYAAADGYVSKVTIEEGSYGKAMYITHPNGTTTLYAHLNRFMDEVRDYVQARQYREQCWQQNITLEPGRFTVLKGQQIALSGNTGASEGPHLHFEIRDTRTGDNINPLTHGINLGDNIAPAISGLYWYNKTGSIYNAKANNIPIQGDEGTYAARDNITVVSSPRICLGISATDKNALDKYRLGIYKAQLYVDGKLQFNFTLNSFNSDDTRYVNAGIDYNNYFNYSKCIQLLCKLPGNKLPVFDGSPGDGVINLSDKKVHVVKILAGDAADNNASLTMRLQYDGSKPMQTNYKQALIPGKAAHITSANAVIDFSSKAIYDALPLHITEENADEQNAASKSIVIHSGNVPVHDSFALQIKTSLPPGNPLRKHVVMQLTNEKQNIIMPVKWKGDYAKAYFSQFGTGQLLIDTVSPTISFKEGDNSNLTQSNKALHILFSDNMGEAHLFHGELDGKWILFEKKGNLFTYNFDSHCKPGSHTLLITAGDKAGNITQQQYSFTYR